MPRERATILTVDDDPRVRDFVAECLRDEYEVVGADDGLRALHWLTDHRADLILVDFVMPRMNGYHFLRVLDAKHLVPNTPVVLMSGLTEKVGQRLRQVTRVRECLAKPFSCEDLLGVVKRNLETQRIRASEPRSSDPGDADAERWVRITACREKLITSLWAAFGDRAEQMAHATTVAAAYELFSAVLYEGLDEEFVGEILAFADETQTS